jgi:sugar phosphate isomerase/epimerase
MDRRKFLETSGAAAGVAKECFREAAALGEEFGVVMVLQNHAPLIRSWKDVLDMVSEVNSPWLKICLDLPIFEKQEK